MQRSEIKVYNILLLPEDNDFFTTCILCLEQWNSRSLPSFLKYPAQRAKVKIQYFQVKGV